MDPTRRRSESPLRSARTKAGLTTGVLSLAERSGYLTKGSAEKLAAALGLKPDALLRGRP